MVFFKIWDTLISGYTFSPYSQHKDHVSGANVFVNNSDNLNLIVSNFLLHKQLHLLQPEGRCEIQIKQITILLYRKYPTSRHNDYRYFESKF